MRKAKVAAVTIGLLASVFGAGTMVTDASTVRLDDSVTNAPEAVRTTTVDNKTTTAAATTTSIQATPTGKKTNAIRQHNRKLATAPEQEISAEELWRVPAVQETNPVENAENTENQAIVEETETESELNEIIEEAAENPEIAESAQAEEASRIFVKSVPSFKHKAQPKKDRKPAKIIDPIIITKPVETSVAVTDPVEASTE
ncbi:MAG: hypothetical protein K2O42_07755, partial [Oscillospiraceae bacterium]|nr:hypothetical protein [Oscillospiraceae bacterium]